MRPFPNKPMRFVAFICCSAAFCATVSPGFAQAEPQSFTCESESADPARSDHVCISLPEEETEAEERAAQLARLKAEDMKGKKQNQNENKKNKNKNKNDQSGPTSTAAASTPTSHPASAVSMLTRDELSGHAIPSVGVGMGTGTDTVDQPGAGRLLQPGTFGDMTVRVGPLAFSQALALQEKIGQIETFLDLPERTGGTGHTAAVVTGQ